MSTANTDYTKKVEKSIIDWESLKTTNILLDTIARHLAVIADGIGKLAHIDYDVKVEGEDDTGDT